MRGSSASTVTENRQAKHRGGARLGVQGGSACSMGAGSSVRGASGGAYVAADEMNDLVDLTRVLGLDAQHLVGRAVLVHALGVPECAHHQLGRVLIAVDKGLFDVCMDWRLKRRHEPGPQVDAFSAERKRRSELLPIAHTARGDKRDAQLARRHRLQDEISDICLPRVACAGRDARASIHGTRRMNAV